MGVHANREPVFLSTYFGDGSNSVAIGDPFCGIHLFGFCGTTCGWRAARRNTIDNNKPRGAMCCKGFASTQRTIQHIAPSAWIMKSPKNYTTDQLLLKFRQSLCQNSWLFWHIAYWAQLNACESCICIFFQHPPPIRVAGIICKFYTPRTRRITNFNHLIAS